MDMTIQKANDKLEFISSDKDALRLYEMREMAMSDYTSGINFAKLENSKEIAKNLIRLNTPLYIVQEATGLDEYVLCKIKAEFRDFGSLVFLF